MIVGRNEYIIKRISFSTIADMDRLYITVYGRKPMRGYHLKKMATGYTGVEFAGLVAYDWEGKPIASLCLVPCFVSYQDQRMLAAQLTDGMTDPAYRKAGLFSRLVNDILILAQEAGIQFIIGFPNQHAAPLLIKMGWKQSVWMDRFVIPVNHSMMKPIISFFQKKRNRYIKGELGGLSFDSSVVRDGFAGIERSPEYVLYKSFTNTTIESAGNMKAWIKIGHDLSIGDMEVTKAGLPEAIKTLQAVAKKAEAGKIFFMASRDTSLHRMFTQYYEPLPSFPVVVRELETGLPVDKLRFTFSDIDIF